MSKLEEIAAGLMQTVFGLAYFFGGPLTFAYLVYTDAQTHHSFLGWCVLLLLDMFLAAIWPIFWLFEFIKYIFS